jgi:hypothetical protein
MNLKFTRVVVEIVGTTVKYFKTRAYIQDEE